MSVSLAQRAQYAYNAGFRNSASIEALSIIVAISQAECGVGSRTGCETGCDAGGDAPNSTCGIWQIYQPAHPGTAACASNPACCATLAWSISRGGTSFGPWSTYNSGAFRQYLTSARAAIASLNLGAQLGPPAPPPPTPAPPTPAPPTPTPAPMPMSTALGWLLLIGGVGVAAYEFRRRGIHVSQPSGTQASFGTAKLAASPTSRPASRLPIKRVSPAPAFGSR